MAISDETIAKRREFPPLWEYIQDFMISVFPLSSILFVMTNGVPAGLTYNIVCGTWARGINAATITTCMMLFSVVFAAERVLNVMDKMRVLPAIFPKIIGEVEYWGVSEMPSKNQMTGNYGGCKVRIAMNCLEKDKEMLSYAVKAEMLKTFYQLIAKPKPEETGEAAGVTKATKPSDPQ